MSRRPLRALLVVGLVALGVPVVAAPAACAAEGTAALVVDTGESDLRYCVALPEHEVSGIDLIVLASEQHGLSYKLGFNGEAVCMLAGVGPTSDDCFEQYPDFWGYWHGDGSGGWSWSGTGAASATVEPGDVEGWSWGSGSNGDTHPRPPSTTHASVCGGGGSGDGAGGTEGGSSPGERPRKDEGGGSARDASHDGQSPSSGMGSAHGSEDPAASGVLGDDSGPPATPRDGRTKDESGGRRAERDRKGRRASEEPGSERVLRPDPPAAEPSLSPASAPASGPPAAGVAGLGAAGLLVLGGAVAGRRRKRIVANSR